LSYLAKSIPAGICPKYYYAFWLLSTNYLIAYAIFTHLSA